MILQVDGSSFATLFSFDVPQIGGLKMMAGYEGNIIASQPIPPPNVPLQKQEGFDKAWSRETNG